MTEIATGYVSLEPQVSGTFGSSMSRQMGGEVNKSGKTLGLSFGKVFAAVAALGVVSKGFGFLKGSLDEAREAQVVGARTDNVIKKMGASSWTSSRGIAAFAGELSKKVGVDDEAIQSGENMLLTFGNVQDRFGKGNDIFRQSTALMVDMSRVMGTDMKGSAIQLGKALNDPTKGVSALARVGVSFTQQQKDQIKKLQESGDILGAQKIVLGELKKQFGGAAKAMVTPADKAAVSWGNFKETVGTLLIPIVDRFFSVMTPVIDQLGNKLPGALAAVKSAVSPVVDIIGNALAPVIQRVTDFIKANPAFVKAFAIALGVLVGAITAVTLATTLFSIALNTTGIPLVIIAIAALVAGLVVAYQKSATFRAIVQQVGAVLQSFAGWVRSDVIPVVLDLAQKVGAHLRPILSQLAATFKADILPTIQKAIAKFREWQPTIQKIAGIVVQLIAKWISFYTAMLGKVIPVLIRFAGFIFKTAVPAVMKYIEIVAKIIGKIIAFGGALVDGVQDVARFAKSVGQKIGDVINWFHQLPGKVKGALSGIGSWLYQAGKDLIQGLINGISSMASSLAGKVKDLASNAVDTVKGAFKIGSPSKVFHGIGRDVVQGFINGIDSKAKHAAAVMKRLLDAIKKAVDDKKITEAAAKRMRATVNAIADEAAKLRSLIAKKAGAARDLASSLRDELDLGALTEGTANEFGFTSKVSPGVAIAGVQAFVQRLKGFARKLRNLAKAGLPAALIGEIASAGSEQGSRIADVFLSATKRQVRQLQVAFHGINTASNAAGLAAANSQYGDNIDRQRRELADMLGHHHKEAAREIGKETARALAEADLQLVVDGRVAGRLVLAGNKYNEGHE